MTPEEKRLHDAVATANHQEVLAAFADCQVKELITLKKIKKLIIQAICKHLNDGTYDTEMTLSLLIGSAQEDIDLCKKLEDEFYKPMTEEESNLLPAGDNFEATCKQTFIDFLRSISENPSGKIGVTGSERVEPSGIPVDEVVREVTEDIEKAIVEYHFANASASADAGEKETTLVSLIDRIDAESGLFMDVVKEFRKKILSGNQVLLATTPGGDEATAALEFKSEEDAPLIITYKMVQKTLIYFYLVKYRKEGIDRLNITPDNCLKKLGLTYEAVLDIQSSANLQYRKSLAGVIQQKLKGSTGKSKSFQLDILYDFIEHSVHFQVVAAYNVCKDDGLMTLPEVKNLIEVATLLSIDKPSHEASETLRLLIQRLEKEPELFSAVREEFFRPMTSEAIQQLPDGVTRHEFQRPFIEFQTTQDIAQLSERTAKKITTIPFDTRASDVAELFEHAILEYRANQHLSVEKVELAKEALENLLSLAERDPLLIAEVMQIFGEKIKAGDEVASAGHLQSDDGAQTISLQGVAGSSGEESLPSDEEQKVTYKDIQITFIKWVYRKTRVDFRNIGITSDNFFDKVGLIPEEIDSIAIRRLLSSDVDEQGVTYQPAVSESRQTIALEGKALQDQQDAEEKLSGIELDVDFKSLRGDKKALQEAHKKYLTRFPPPKAKKTVKNVHFSSKVEVAEKMDRDGPGRPK